MGDKIWQRQLRRRVQNRLGMPLSNRNALIQVAFHKHLSCWSVFGQKNEFLPAAVMLLGKGKESLQLWSEESGFPYCDLHSVATILGTSVQLIAIFALLIYIHEQGRILDTSEYNAVQYNTNNNANTYNWINTSITLSKKTNIIGIIKAVYMAQRLYWTVLECTGLLKNVATGCILQKTSCLTLQDTYAIAVIRSNKMYWCIFTSRLHMTLFQRELHDKRIALQLETDEYISFIELLFLSLSFK